MWRRDGWIRAPVVLLVLTSSALAQAPSAEEQGRKRAFCQRVAEAAMRCGPSLDLTGLSACMLRGLAFQDSLRLAQLTAVARGNPASVLTECGISR